MFSVKIVFWQAVSAINHHDEIFPIKLPIKFSDIAINKISRLIVMNTVHYCNKLFLKHFGHF